MPLLVLVDVNLFYIIKREKRNGTYNYISGPWIIWKKEKWGLYSGRCPTEKQWSHRYFENRIGTYTTSEAPDLFLYKGLGLTL